jgi:D-alanyl-D-alanine carboxypeptidase (penicillin-binding protein 5/6)
MPGVDGLKTGFTNAAGFNLAASAVRDGRRLITVVLGGSSGAARDENVEELLNAGFNVLSRRAKGDHITLASVISEPDDESGPLQRAPVEQGSADQPDLKVVVQPQVRTLPVMAAAGALSSKPAEPADVTPHAAEVAKVQPLPAPVIAQPAKTEAMAEAKAQPCPTRRRRHAAACAAAAPSAPIQTAKADLRPRAPTPLKAPEKAAEKASEHKGEKLADKGGFMIQVGAYKNAAQAKDHLDKVAGDFGRVVGAALADVEKAGGNYRARFRGLNEKQAKAACQALSAKGQQCMVMGAS